jgi:hypothetical protein
MQSDDVTAGVVVEVNEVRALVVNSLGLNNDIRAEISL